MSFFKKRKKRKYKFLEIDPGDVLLDAKNVSGLNKKNFDNVIETPLSKKSIFIVFYLFLIFFSIFIVKIFYLQIIKGDEYRKIVKMNSIKSKIIFEKRGIIKDRNDIPLAWNFKNESKDYYERKYIDEPGFSHLVGYIKYPHKDKKEIYYQKEYKPKTGVEKLFNSKLQGKNGKKIININSGQKELSKIYKEDAIPGENINLSIDAEAQTLFSKEIAKYVEENDFKAGVVLVMDVHTGEIIVATSYPEYNQNILTDGSDYKIISSYFTDKRRPSLARFSFATYTPGSIMKIFMAIAGLNEGIIDPDRIIHTTGRFKVGRYTFYDWKNHGDINLYSAIANSSNIYFYIVGGGLGDKKGLGIKKIAKYFKDFGFGEKTGIYDFVTNENEKIGEKKGLIPTPEWKKKHDGQDWYIGNTYYTSIGQYAVSVTPLQILVAVSAIANNGEVLVPKLLKDEKKEIKRKLSYKKEYFKIVRDTMRQTILRGTAQSSNVDFLEIAGKTGTAELGVKRDRVNSLMAGFFPYKDPKYAFVVIGEDGPPNKHNYVSLAWAKMIKALHKQNPDHIFFK